MVISRLSIFLSWILHPLLMPTYAILLAFYLTPYLNYSVAEPFQRAILLTVIITTFFLPLMVQLLFLRVGRIKDLFLDNARERHLPFIATAVCYFLGYYLLKSMPLPKIFHLFLLGAVTSVLIAGLINYRYKISLHMIGIGGMCGALFGLSQIIIADLVFPVIITFIAAGLIGTARLYLGKHSQLDIYTGFIVGFVTLYIILAYFS